MKKVRSVFFFLGSLFLPFAASFTPRTASALQPLVQVPAYSAYYGSGPTAGMMILAYWDAHGYPDLIPGRCRSADPGD